MLHHQSSYTPNNSAHSAAPPTPHYQTHNPYSHYGGPTQTPSHHQSIHQPQYALQGLSAQRAAATAAAAAAPTTSHGSHSSNYNPPRQPEVYTFDEMANSNVPVDIRAQFHHDKGGKIIWYTAPPLDFDPLPQQKQALGHSLRYLADKARNKEAERKKRSAHKAEMAADAVENAKRQKVEMAAMKEQNFTHNTNVMQQWCNTVENGTDEIYQQLDGDDWKKIRQGDMSRLAAMQGQAFREKLEVEKYRERVEKERQVRIGAIKL